MEAKVTRPTYLIRAFFRIRLYEWDWCLNDHFDIISSLPFMSIAFPFHSLKPEKETKTASGTAVIN